jgi:hypothetical protein
MRSKSIRRVELDIDTLQHRAYANILTSVWANTDELTILASTPHALLKLEPLVDLDTRLERTQQYTNNLMVHSTLRCLKIVGPLHERELDLWLRKTPNIEVFKYIVHESERDREVHTERESLLQTTQLSRLRAIHILSEESELVGISYITALVGIAPNLAELYLKYEARLSDKDIQMLLEGLSSRTHLRTLELCATLDRSASADLSSALDTFHSNELETYIGSIARRLDSNDAALATVRKASHQ